MRCWECHICNSVPFGFNANDFKHVHLTVGTLFDTISFGGNFIAIRKERAPNYRRFWYYVEHHNISKRVCIFIAVSIAVETFELLRAHMQKKIIFHSYGSKLQTVSCWYLKTQIALFIPIKSKNFSIAKSSHANIQNGSKLDFAIILPSFLELNHSQMCMKLYIKATIQQLQLLSK